MPYAPEHKQKTRARIIDAARSLFNQRGFVEVSIDEIMAEAGLTRGGFYHHFRSKEALFAEAIQQFSQRTPCQQMEQMGLNQHSPVDVLAQQLVNAYLSQPHLQDLNSQCPLVALPSDAARAGHDVRVAYTDLLQKMLGLFESSFKQHKNSKQEASARDQALVLAALCVGGMVLARTISEPQLSAELLQATQNFGAGLLRAEPDQDLQEGSQRVRPQCVATR